MKKDAKIIIAAGGTGGHIFPGIAIAEEIRRVYPYAIITFAGTKRGLETKILPRLGLHLDLIDSSSIKDRKGFGRIFAWMKLPLSIAQCVSLIMKKKPDILISIGGYAAGPLMMAAMLVRVPFVLVEPNAVAGFANKLVGRFAKIAFVPFEQTKKYFSKTKVILSGNPVRDEILKIRHGEREDKKHLTIFVFGGSQGARTLNRAMLDALKFMAGIKDRVSVIHQTGSFEDIKLLENAYLNAGIKADVFTFNENMQKFYFDADLVIARSGATTVAEVSAIGLPSILVPYPFAADDHQRANAKMLMDAGGAIMMDDSKCNGENLAREILSLIENPEKLSMMRIASLGVGRPEAAKRIVEECWKVI